MWTWHGKHFLERRGGATQYIDFEQNSFIKNSNLFRGVYDSLHTVTQSIIANSNTINWPKILLKKAHQAHVWASAAYLIFSLVAVVVTAQAQTALYMLDVTNNRLLRSGTDGNGLTILIDGAPLNDPHGIAIDAANEQVYIANTNTGEVLRTDLDGANIVTLVNSGLTQPIGIELNVAAGHFYISDRGTNKIVRYDLDGSNATDALTTSLNGPHNFALDLANSKFYIANRNSGNAISADLSGNSGISVLFTGAGQPYGMALDLSNSHMYTSRFGDNEIRRHTTAGGSETLIATGLSQPTGMRIDLANGYLYFTEWAGQKVRRIDLDGSNLTDIMTSADGLGQMIDLEIYTSTSQNVHYIPFRSDLVLLILLALVGLWLLNAGRKN